MLLFSTLLSWGSSLIRPDADAITNLWTLQPHPYCWSPPAGTTITDQVPGAEDDVPGITSGAQDALLEAMSPFENYINGMLTNYKQLPLDRLHKMLQLFVISPK